MSELRGAPPRFLLCRRLTSAYVSIRQHTYADVSRRMLTHAEVGKLSGHLLLCRRLGLEELDNLRSGVETPLDA
jgi:hypothetical protein